MRVISTNSNRYNFGPFPSRDVKMAARVRWLLCFVFLSVAFWSVAYAVACTFVSGSKCKCVLSDGSGEIDLSPLFARGKLSVQGTGEV